MLSMRLLNFINETYQDQEQDPKDILAENWDLLYDYLLGLLKGTNLSDAIIDLERDKANKIHVTLDKVMIDDTKYQEEINKRISNADWTKINRLVISGKFEEAKKMKEDLMGDAENMDVEENSERIIANKTINFNLNNIDQIEADLKGILTFIKDALKEDDFVYV